MSGLGLKRAFDLAAAGTGLLVGWPFMVVIAAAVRVDSAGPALFRQDRVGLHERTFRIHKFRTMRAGIPGAAVSPTSDPRITRVGAVLRRTKLDELPQLIDVLTGRMSLVGPRPELPEYVALWPEPDRDIILSVRPGITDPASVEFRHESDVLGSVDDPELHYVSVLLPRKVSMYVAYVRTRSFTGDLRILATTFSRLITR